LICLTLGATQQPEPKQVLHVHVNMSMNEQSSAVITEREYLKGRFEDKMRAATKAWKQLITLGTGGREARPR
jgi:hypothetical protein